AAYMVRNTLLYLSRQRSIEHAIENFGIARNAAHRFVAGDTLPDAIAAVKKLNQQGMHASLDHLGENVEQRDAAIRATTTNLEILDTIAEHGLDCNLSIKLTQLGLDIDETLCFDNVVRILERAD